MRKYILKGKTPELIDNILEWGRWFEKSERHVAKTDLPNNVQVSTVFLGIDHSFGKGEPILFETMIFGGKHDGYQERYENWAQAEAGHLKAVEIAGGKREE